LAGQRKVIFLLQPSISPEQLALVRVLQLAVAECFRCVLWESLLFLEAPEECGEEVRV